MNFRNRISSTLAIVLLLSLQGTANAKVIKVPIVPPNSPTLVSVETSKTYSVVEKVKVVSLTAKGKKKTSFLKVPKLYTDVQVQFSNSAVTGGASISYTVVNGGGKTCKAKTSKNVCTLAKIPKGTEIYVLAKSKNKKGFSTLSSPARYVTGSDPWPMPNPKFSLSKTLIRTTTSSPISSFVPVSTGGPIASFSITESLPSGISLDSHTGELSGTASIPQSSTIYTLIAANESGSFSQKFQIEVVPVPNISINIYSIQTSVGNEILSFEPSNIGGSVETWSLNPSTPPGLRLDQGTGRLVGSATVAQNSISYTLTAANQAGESSVNFYLEVIAAPDFSLSAASESIALGSPLNVYGLTDLGGAYVSYQISPSAPAGTIFDTTTGLLSGTPSAAQPSTTYTVSSTNIAGSFSRTYSLEVIAAPSFTLAVASEQIAINSSIALFGITPTGGTTVTYSVSPQLPAGVSLDSQTGLVSGTPVAPQPLTAYTITATNIAGQESHTYSLQVIAAPDFSLSVTSERLPKNNQISGYTINSIGGQTSIFSITPSIPNGTVFNTTTGLLSGTPTLPQGPTEYTIKGTNIAGSVSKIFSLEVTNPPVFTLSKSAVSVYLADSVVSYSISSVGSPITSFALDKPLPAGLVLDPATGLLSGTPTASQPLTTYTITGMNSSGSVSKSFTLTVDLTCATGGACVVGNTGPGGGYVFYVNEAGFTCGELMDVTCKYMELAPNTWAGGSADPKMAITPSARKAAGSIAGLAEASADVVGRGAWNSRHMVSAWGSSENYPALAADNYTSNYLGVSKSDWFIGSKGELDAMTVVKGSLPTTRFAYAADKYWPSSFNPGYVSNVDGGECGTSWPQGVGPGATTSTNKPTSTPYSVRAIRAW